MDTELVNIFIMYYQKRFNDPKSGMFKDIDPEKKDSVNRIMELFYDELKKYEDQEKDANKITISKPGSIDYKLFDEVYCLKIDNVEKAVCPSLLAMLKFIQLKVNDWQKKHWIIIKLK